MLQFQSFTQYQRFFKNLLTLILIPQLAFARTASIYDPTDDLITAFCPGNVGPFTQTALNYSKSLATIIASMRDNPACRAVYTSLEGLNSSLLILGRTEENSNEYEKLESRVNNLGEELQLERASLINQFIDNFKLKNPGASEAELNTAIANYSPSSNLLSTLSAEFATSKIGLTDAQINENLFGRRNQRHSRILNILLFQKYAQQLNSALSSSTGCNSDALNIATAIGAQIIGAAATIQGGIVGASILGAGVIATGISNLVRELRYNTKIHKINNLRLSVGVSCAIEGMAQTWCQARDLQTILKTSIIMHNMDREDVGELENTYDGIDLISKKLPVFTNWVQRVAAGSASASMSQAQQRIKALQLRFNLISTENLLEGAINETTLKINNLRGSDEEIHEAAKLLRLKLMSGLIFIVRSRVTMNGEIGPYFNSFIADNYCGPQIYFFSKGTQRRKIITNGTDLQCDTYVNNRFPEALENPHSIAELRHMVSELNNEALIFVNQELGQVLEVNPSLVMAQLESINSRFLNPPKEFVAMGLRYLQRLESQLDPMLNHYLLDLIDKTKNILAKAKEIIDKRCTSEDPIDCLSLVTQQLSDLRLLLVPNQTILYIGDTFAEVVKQDIDHKIQNGDLNDEELKLILLISPENSIDVLIRRYLGIQKARDDASVAKNMIERNLELLGDSFKSKLYDRIRFLHKYLKYEEASDQDKKRELALLCIRTLLIPNNSSLNGFFYSNIRKKYCPQAIYRSSIPTRVPDLSYDELYQKKKFEERVCSLYDHRRKLNLFEIYDRDLNQGEGDESNRFLPHPSFN